MVTNIIILIVGLLTLGVLFYVVPKLRKVTPNVDYQAYMDNSQKLLEIVTNLSGTLGVENNVIEKIIKYSQLAVNYAEQLYVTGQLPAEERKTKAVDFVIQALTEAGVVVSDSQVQFIEMTIESIVFLLPKEAAKTTETTTDSSEVK